MRKTNLWLAILFAASSFFVSQIASAADTGMNKSDTQSTNQQSSMSQQSMAQQLPRAIRVDKGLVGKTVNDQNGNQLGKVEDVVVGNQGQIAYVILSANDKFYPIPFQALHPSNKKDEFAINMTKDKLNGAPSFTKNEWPDLISSQWEQSVFSYYGEQPPQQGQQNFKNQGQQYPQGQNQMIQQPNAQSPDQAGTTDQSQSQQQQ